MIQPSSTRTMDWPRIWFKLFGSAQIVLGALSILVWQVNRSIASHGGPNMRRALPVGIALIVLGAGALCRERVTVTLSSVGFALIACAFFYADRKLPLLSFSLLAEAICAATLLLPAIFTFRFRHATRWFV